MVRINEEIYYLENEIKEIKETIENINTVLDQIEKELGKVHFQVLENKANIDALRRKIVNLEEKVMRNE